MFQDEFYQAFVVRLDSWKDFSQAQLHRLADFAVAQAQFESANFTSNVFQRNNNAIGYKYYSGSLWQLGPGVDSPEGDRYARYQTVADSARELADWIHRRKLLFKSATDLSQYVSAMKQQGYFGDHEALYLNGLDQYYQERTAGDLDETVPGPLIQYQAALANLDTLKWAITAAMIFVALYVFRAVLKLLRRS